MPEWLARFYRDIRPNARWDIIKGAAKLIIWGSLALFAWYSTRQTNVPGVPPVLIGVAIFAVLAFALAAVAFAVSTFGKFRTKDQKQESPPISDPRLHDDCDRKIRNLQSTITRLRQNDQTQGIQISARDTQIEQLEAKLSELKTCPYELVHRIADHQAKNIRDFVTVSRVAVWEHKLNEPVPAIKWGFMVQNKSIFPISLVEIENNIFFEKTELAEKTFERHNELEHLQYWREGSVVFEQRLSGVEAQYIRNTPDGKFRFNGLTIKVGNSNNYPVIEPQELVLGDDLETTLNGITYKETEGMKSLRKEIVSLRQQAGELEELKARAPKEGLTFEIDAQRTKVFISGRSTDSHTYQVNVRLRCWRDGDSKLAVRAFAATLFAAGENKDVLFWKQGPVIAYAEPHMDPVDIEKGWTIDVPLTGFRWYYFFFDITDMAASFLTPRDHFFRVTMDAVGQEPQHIDFFVDSWKDALKSESGVTLRRAMGAHHESA